MIQPDYRYRSRTQRVLRKLAAGGCVGEDNDQVRGNYYLSAKQKRDHAKAIPNPTSGRLTFSMILENENKVEIGAYDLAGRFVFSKIENGQKGKNDFQIQVSDLSKGVYFFKIKTELGEAIEKVMVF